MDAQAKELAVRLRGVMTAMVTPFAPDRSLDLGALIQHVDFQLEQGVEVLAVAGSIGEYSSLDHQERKAMTEAVVRAVGGRATVLVGAASDQLTEIRELALHAADAGADGLLAALPPHFKLTEDEQFDFWAWLATASPLPFVLYAAADAASGAPSMGLLERVRSLPGLAGYKEPLPNLARVQEFVGRFGADLRLIAAAEVALPQTLMAGAVGCMTSTACFAPALVRGIVDGVANDDLKAVRAAFAPILTFRAGFQDQMQRGYPSFLPYTKAACEIVGLPTGPPRPPLHAVAPREQERLRTTLLEAGIAS